MKNVDKYENLYHSIHRLFTTKTAKRLENKGLLLWITFPHLRKRNSKMLVGLWITAFVIEKNG